MMVPRCKVRTMWKVGKDIREKLQIFCGVSKGTCSLALPCLPRVPSGPLHPQAACARSCHHPHRCHHLHVLCRRRRLRRLLCGLAGGMLLEARGVDGAMSCKIRGDRLVLSWAFTTTLHYSIQTNYRFVFHPFKSIDSGGPSTNAPNSTIACFDSTTPPPARLTPTHLPFPHTGDLRFLE
ncbi:hypothetical protein AVEN_60584-1 [Araneus ventricosus]|uniref:Uncharacterized protein n=1 Tax=Araneus ventricosus TaxID=182803 RepID=A0A4Y2F2E4_ARAVE|nr:hypothetical protein AVEN_60584-1 [Araneus ventricosus]